MGWTVEIDRGRLLDLFLELCSADSAPLAERPVFQVVLRRLKEMGFDVYVDDAGEKAGGEVGNLLAAKPGTGRLASARPLLFSAHMDRVAGGIGVRPRVAGGVVTSSGDTVLGADDAAGIAAILEAYRAILDSGADHPPFECLFTIGEEIGLVGAREADLSRFASACGFVLDADGPVGTVVAQAPTQYTVTATIFGRAAHAGIAPERGVSAIKIAAQAISRMQLGRIDAETTANVGYIAGGGPTNIVPERAEIRAETRSLDRSKVERQLAQMRAALQEAAAACGGRAEVRAHLEYEGFRLSESAEPVERVRRAAQRLGLPFAVRATGGGSDANVFNAKGLPCAVLGVGYQAIHTYKEAMPIEELCRLARLVAALIMDEGDAR